MTGAIGRALCIVATLLSVAIFVPSFSLAVSGAANAQCRSGDYTCDYPGTKTVGTGQYATKVQCMRNAPCRDTTAQTTTNGKCVAFETCSVSKETDKDITGKPSGWQGEGDTSGGSAPSSPGATPAPSIPSPGNQPPNADPTNSFNEPAKPTESTPPTKGESILERFFKSFGGPSTPPGENTTDPLGMPTGLDDSGTLQPDMNNNYGYGNSPEDNFGYGNPYQDGNTTFGPQANPTPADDAPWYERAWNSVTAALTPSESPVEQTNLGTMEGFPVQQAEPHLTNDYGYGNPNQTEAYNLPSVEDPRLPSHFDPQDPLFNSVGPAPTQTELTWLNDKAAADIRLAEKQVDLAKMETEFKPLNDRAVQLKNEIDRLEAGAQKTDKSLVFRTKDELNAYNKVKAELQKMQPELQAASTRYGQAIADYNTSVQAYNKEFFSATYDAMGTAYYGPGAAENAALADKMGDYRASGGKFYDAFGGTYTTPSEAAQADRFLLKNAELANQYQAQQTVVDQFKNNTSWWSRTFGSATRGELLREEGKLAQLKDAMTTNTAVANYLSKGVESELLAERLNVEPKTPQELAVRSLLYGQVRDWDQNYSLAETMRNGSTRDLQLMGYLPTEGQDVTREDLIKHFQFRTDLSAGRIAELTGEKEMTPQTLWSIATLTKSPADFEAFNRAYLDVTETPTAMMILGEDRYHRWAGEVFAYGQTSIDSFVSKAFKDASERLTLTTPSQWAPGVASLLAGSIVGNVGEFVGLPTTQRSIEMLSQTPGEIAFSRGISGPMAFLDMTTLSAPKLAFTGTSLALREASLAAGEFKFGAGLTEGLSATEARVATRYAQSVESNISGYVARGEMNPAAAQRAAYSELYEQIARSDAGRTGQVDNLMNSLRTRMEALDVTPPGGFQARGATVADSAADVGRASDQVVTPAPSAPSANVGNIPRAETPITNPSTGGRVADGAIDAGRVPEQVVTPPSSVGNVPRVETPITNPSTVSPVTNTSANIAMAEAREIAAAEALAEKAAITQQAAAARTYEEAFAARTKAEEVQANLNTQIARELESMAAQNVVRETDTLRQLRQANADIQNVQTDLAKTMAREAVSSPPNISRSPYNEVVLSNKFGPIGRAQTLAASVFAESALSVRRIVTAPDKLLQAAIAAFQIQVGGIEAGNAGTNALESIYRASMGENMLTLTPDEVARLTNPSRTISSPIASRVSDAVSPVVSTALPISRFDATDLLGNANPFVQSIAVQTPRGVGLASEVSSAQQSFITYEGGKVVFNFKSANQVAPGGASYSIDLANLRVSAVSTVPQPSVPNTAPAQVTPGTAVTAQAPAQTVPVTTSRYGVAAFFTNGIPNAAKSVWNSIVSPSQAAEPVARVSAPVISQASESARPLLSRNDIEKMMQVGPVDEARVPSFQPSNFLNGPATQPKELLGSLSPVERVEKITETMRKGEEALNALWKQRFAEIGKEFSPPAVLPGKWFSGDQFIVTQNSIRFNIAASHYENFGTEAVLSALAHEYGHAVQTQLGILPSNENIRLYEMQADYLAGTALRPLFEQGLLKPGDEEFIYYSRVYQGRDLHNERNGINSLLGRVAPDSELRLATARVRGDLVNQGLSSGDWTKEVNVFDGSKIAPITGQKFGAVTPSNVIVPEGGSLAATLPSRLALEGANWLSNFSPRQALAQAWDSIKPISSARAATPPVGGEVAVPTAPAGSPVSARTTFYGPGAGGTVQGGWETSRANLEGLKNERGSPIPRTLDDVRLGKAGYVSLAVDPSNYGKFYNLGPVTYKSVLDKKIYTGDKLAAEASLKKTDPNLHMTYVPQLEKVIGYAHDTGGAFTGRPDKFDIAVGDFRGWSAGDSMRFLTSAGQEYGGNKLNTWQQINPVQARQYIAAVTAKPPAAVAEMTPKPPVTKLVVEAVRSANTPTSPTASSPYERFKERLSRPVKAVQAAFTPAPAVNPPAVTSRGPAQAAPQESLNAPRRLSQGGNKEFEAYTDLSVVVGKDTLARQGYIFIPASIDTSKPITVFMYMHGQLENATLRNGRPNPDAFRQTIERQQLAQQIRDSGMNAVLIAPDMGGIPAASGYFTRPGETTKFLAAAEQGIAQSIGIPQDALKAGPVVLATYSGGYYPAGNMLASGELNQRLSAILMLDSGYGTEANGFLNGVKNWTAANPSGIVVSGYTVSTRSGNSTLTELFRNPRTKQLTRTISTSPLPANEVIQPGTFAVIPTQGAAAAPHRNYVTNAGLTTAGVQPPIQTFLQMLPSVPNPAATAVAQGTPNTIQTTARSAATTVAKPVSDLASRALTRLGQRADVEAIRPATVPPANIQSTASQEQIAQQAIAQERARNAAATDVQLAAAVAMRGAENTNAFEQLRVNIAKSLAKSLKQSDVNKAYTPANVAIAKEMAERLKPTELNPNPRLESWTKDQPGTTQKLVNDYLWEAYQRQPLKIDSGGDFTWKDITGALNSRNSLRDYVIGGMNERLRTNLYFAGKAMDEAGIQWSFLAGYRGLERPAATGKVVANPLHSEHYAGGYGLANAADLGGVGVTAAQRNASNQAVWNWLKNNQTDNAAKYGLRAKFIPNDPAHVVPNIDRKLHATQQSDIQKILASNPQPPTSAPAGLAQTPDASLPTQQPTAQPSTMTGRFMSRIALAPERFSRSVGTVAEGAYQNIRAALTPETVTVPQPAPAVSPPAPVAPSSPVTTVQGLSAEQVAGIKKYVDAQEVLKKAPIGDQAATKAYNTSIDDLKKVGLTLNDYGLVYYSPTEGRNANVVSTEALRAAGFDRTAQGQLMAANTSVTPPSVKIVDVAPVAPQPVPAVSQPTPPVPGATETVRGWLQRSQEEFSRVTKQLRTGEPSSEVAKPAPNVFTSSDGEIIVHLGSAENLHEMVNPNPFKETFSSIVPKPVEIPAVISSVDDVALAQQKRLKEVSESMLKAMYGTETLDAMPARTYREPFLERFYRAQLEAANEAIVRLEINKTQNAINDLAPGGVVADAARAQFDALAEKLTSQKIAQSELLKGNIPAYSAFLNKYATSQKFTQAGLTAEIRSGEEYLVKKLGADWRATDMRNVDPLMRQSIEIQMRNEALAEYVRAGKIALAENSTPTQTAARANLITDLRAGIDKLVTRITPSPSRVATPAAEPVETFTGSDGDVIVVKKGVLIDPEIPTGVASNPAPVAQQTPAASKPVPAVSRPIPTVKHAPTTNVTEVVRQATRPTVAVPGDEYKVTLKTVDENLKKLQSVEAPLLETLQSVTSSFNRTGDRGVLKARLKEAVPAYQNYNSLRLQTLSELQKLQKNPALSAKEAQELGRVISTLNSRGSQLGRMLKEDAFMSAVSLFDINGSLSAHLTKVSIAARVLQETRLGAANTVLRLASAEETRVIAAANAPAKAVQANAAPVTAPTPVTKVEVTPIAAPTAPAPAVANSGSAPTSISEVISKIREDSLTRSFFDAGVVLGTAGIALKATDAVAKVLKKTTAAVANTWKATFSRTATAPAAPAAPARPATPAAPTPAAPAAPAAPTPTAPSPRGVLPSLGAVRSAASRASAALAPVARAAGLRVTAGTSALTKSVRNWANTRATRVAPERTVADLDLPTVNPRTGRLEFPPTTASSLPGRFIQGAWGATKWCFSGFGKFTACAVGGGIGYYILEAVNYSLSGDTAAAPAGPAQAPRNPNTPPNPGTQQPGTQQPGTRTPGSPDTPGATPAGGTADSGLGGLGGLGSLTNIAKSLPQLMQNLKNLFNPQQSTQPTMPTNIPTVKLDANPMSVVSGTTTRLSWSSENSASCTVIGPGSATLTRGGASGVITSPALATSTEFAVICSGIDGLSATNATVTVSVDGSTAPTVPVILPAGVTKNASYSTAFNSSSGSTGSGSASGTGNGNTTSSNGTNEAPVTPKTSGVDQYGNKVSAWCDPNQSIDTYTTCLCNLEPTGCYPWRTRQQ